MMYKSEPQTPRTYAAVPAQGLEHRGLSQLHRLGAAARASPTVTRLSVMQRRADIRAPLVIQRAPEHRDALAMYLTKIGAHLQMTPEERDEILDTAQELENLTEGMEWLADWVASMNTLKQMAESGQSVADLDGPKSEVDPPAPQDKDAGLKRRLAQDLQAHGLTDQDLLDSERDGLIRLLRTIETAATALAESSITKTQRQKQTKTKNSASTAYGMELAAVKTRLERDADERRQQHAAQKLRQAFDQDKQLLTHWVDQNVSGGSAKVLHAVLNAHTLGSGNDATVDKMFPARDIMDAHDDWWRLYAANKTQLKVFCNFQNPGNLEAAIYWKDRGSQWECTRNFIAIIGKHTSNVHVTPNGGSPKKKKSNSSAPAPIGGG